MREKDHLDNPTVRLSGKSRMTREQEAIEY